MGEFYQHYYTWSLGGLSGNKVGLGIVASSTQNIRNYDKQIEMVAAGCNVCRNENITIEKLCYSKELKRFLLSGVTPCAAGMDRRANKFVHVYSSVEESTDPAVYFSPQGFETEAGQTKELPVAHFSNLVYDPVKIAKKYKINETFGVFYDKILKALLAGKQPLHIVWEEGRPDEFAKTAREIMYLIHCMLPKSLRTEADYISYAEENCADAHIIFQKEAKGRYCYTLGKKETSDFDAMETAFYDKMQQLFFENKTAFQKAMDQMQQLLEADKTPHNIMEKWMFLVLADDIKNGKTAISTADLLKKLNYFVYWARKDRELIPYAEHFLTIFHPDNLSKEEKNSFCEVLLTATAGKTSETAFQKLNELLEYEERKDREHFLELIDLVRKNNATIYGNIMDAYKKQDYTKCILNKPVYSTDELKWVVSYHKKACEEKEYKAKVIKEAYELYLQQTDEKDAKEVEDLIRKIQPEGFLKEKRKDLERYLAPAKTLRQLKDLLSQLKTQQLEKEIREDIFQKSYSIFNQKKEDFSEQKLFYEIAKAVSMDKKAHTILLAQYKKWVKQKHKLTQKELEQACELEQMLHCKQKILKEEQKNRALRKKIQNASLSELISLWKNEKNEELYVDFAKRYQKWCADENNVTMPASGNEEEYLMALEILALYTSQRGIKKLWMQLLKEHEEAAQLVLTQCLECYWQQKVCTLKEIVKCLFAAGVDETKGYYWICEQKNEKTAKKQWEKEYWNYAKSQKRADGKFGMAGEIVGNMANAYVPAFVGAGYAFLIFTFFNLYGMQWVAKCIGILFAITALCYGIYLFQNRKSSPVGMLYAVNVAGLGILLFAGNLLFTDSKFAMLYFGISGGIAVLTAFIRCILAWRK